MFDPAIARTDAGERVGALETLIQVKPLHSATILTCVKEGAVANHQTAA
jgi:hypothetical protein